MNTSLNRKILFLALMSFTCIHVHAQNEYGTLEGLVTNAQGDPLQFVNIVVKPGDKGASTNEEGRFKISGIQPGSYTLFATAIGFQHYEERVSMGRNETLTVTISLTEQSETLSEISITASRGQALQTLNKMDVPLRDLPITVHSIDRTMIEQRGANELGDALKNVTGIRPRNTYGGFQHFHVRGMEQFVLLVDGVRDERHNISQSAPSTNLAAVEGIDVLKGPSSVLFGHSALGGIINIRRKQPSEIFTGEFATSYGSFNTRRISAGAGGPVTKKLSFRTDVGLSEAEGFRGLSHSIINGYLSLRYSITARQSIQLSVQANDDFYSTDTGIPVLADGSLVPGMNPLTRYNDPQDFLKNKRTDFQLRYEFQINDNLKLSNVLSYYNDDINYLSTELLAINATQDSLTRSFPFYFNHQTKPLQNQLELSGSYFLGGLKSKFVIGHSLSILDRKTYRGTITGTGLKAAIAIQDPILNQGALFITDNLYQARMETVNGLFAQNWFEFSDKLKAMAAIRMDIFSGDYFTNRVDAQRNITEKGVVSTLNITALTYRLGVVYQPVEPVSVYGSYSTYFKPTRTVAADGTLFDPEEGYQAELGLRYDLHSKVMVNFSGFALARTNILENLGGGNFRNIGTGTSRGVELDIQGSLTENLSLSMGYAYARTRVEPNSDNQFINPSAGNRLRFAPEHLVNSWLTYQVHGGSLKGLGIGAGVHYTGDNYTDAANTYRLPAYALLDAALWYRFDRFEIKLNGNNLTNEFYYRDAIFSNQYFPGNSRNFLATFSARF